MKRLTQKSIFVALFVGVTACHQQRSANASEEAAKEKNEEVFHSRAAEKDADFVVHIIGESYAGIELAKVATARSTDPEIKKVAKSIEVNDARMLGELRAYADKNGITISEVETDEAKAERNKLIDSQDNFNSHWLSLEKDHYQDMIKQFDTKGHAADDGELKNWVNSTLPSLQSSLESLKEIEEIAH